MKYIVFSLIFGCFIMTSVLNAHNKRAKDLKSLKHQEQLTPHASTAAQIHLLPQLLKKEKNGVIS